MGDIIDVDFRFTEIALELGSLWDYHETIESQFEDLKTRAVEKAKFGWDLDDDGERQIAWQLADLAAEVNLPRLLWGSFVVMTWAVFEAAVIEIADFLRKAHKIPLRIVELKGDLVHQAKRYYLDVLKFPLTDFGDAAWEQIVHTSRVRDALVHSAGRMDMVPSTMRPRIEKLIEQESGIYLDHVMGNYLVVRQDFATASLEAIEGVLKDAVERAKAEADRLREATP